ncbi:NAD(P)H dehydrogenase (quinone) [Prauserella shujinwangii]|uniref:NAD(P)H dehydrogenase (Quinone) n=1 Tax=Prauserella shujinwangii TaxID=1453103 RepID=A0A2T0M0Y9_9PSEU|nr:SDR family oxidoreductase [Prauserella shujinwangii]PRX50248.1 NAD(P)H dehydrogenase (quinone) [Prauserella shujinwangii]
MIVVTGATGQLGRLALAALRERVPDTEVVAAVRNPAKAADLGVEVREADYDRPETLPSAFAGADRVLFISGSEVGRRVPQHAAVVVAAKEAGAGHLVYTSAPKADTSPLILAPEHRETERIIRESGLPFTFLRNNWYTENYEQNIRQAAETGVYLGSAGEGRVASAPRADYAEAAAVVLTSAGHEGRVYELSGDTAWSYADLAAEISAAAGREVGYRDVSPEEHRAALASAGLPDAVVDLVVGLDADTRQGLLAGTTGELKALLGRPTTPLADSVREILARG